MKRIWFILITVIVLLAFTVNVSASVGIPDLTQKGNLSLDIKYNGELLNSGAVNLCYVASLEKADSETYEFKLIEALQNPLLDMEDLTNPELAESLLYSVKQRYLPKTSASVTDGKAFFPDLSAGLYLVWQDASDAAEGFLPIQPFLISVPLRQGDRYVLDVVAAPKMPINPTPSESPAPTPSPTPTPPGPPTPTPPPHLPQTGQLNWPIPLLAFSGAILFVVGLLLCISGKRRHNEK